MKIVRIGLDLAKNQPTGGLLREANRFIVLASRYWKNARCRLPFALLLERYCA